MQREVIEEACSTLVGWVVQAHGFHWGYSTVTGYATTTGFNRSPTTSRLSGE